MSERNYTDDDWDYTYYRPYEETKRKERENGGPRRSGESDDDYRNRINNYDEDY